MAVHFILRACADVIFAPDPARGRLSLIKYTEIAKIEAELTWDQAQF